MRGRLLGGCLLLDCAVAVLVMLDCLLMYVLAFYRRRHLQGEWRVQNEARRVSAPRPGAVWHRVQLIRKVCACCFLRAAFSDAILTAAALLAHRALRLSCFRSRLRETAVLASGGAGRAHR